MSNSYSLIWIFNHNNHHDKNHKYSFFAYTCIFDLIYLILKLHELISNKQRFIIFRYAMQSIVYTISALKSLFLQF